MRFFCFLQQRKLIYAVIHKSKKNEVINQSLMSYSVIFHCIYNKRHTYVTVFLILNYMKKGKRKKIVSIYLF
jgi:hypothetical protein